MAGLDFFNRPLLNILKSFRMFFYLCSYRFGIAKILQELLLCNRKYTILISFFKQYLETGLLLQQFDRLLISRIIDELQDISARGITRKGNIDDIDTCIHFYCLAGNYFSSCIKQGYSRCIRPFRMYYSGCFIPYRICE